MNDKQDIEFKFGKRGEAGSYNPKTKKIQINLRYVETIHHLIQLIEHEVIHKILDDEKFDDYKEHELIYRLMWADYII